MLLNMFKRTKHNRFLKRSLQASILQNLTGPTGSFGLFRGTKECFRISQLSKKVTQRRREKGGYCNVMTRAKCREGSMQVSATDSCYSSKRVASIMDKKHQSKADQRDWCEVYRPTINFPRCENCAISITSPRING